MLPSHVIVESTEIYYVNDIVGDDVNFVLLAQDNI